MFVLTWWENEPGRADTARERDVAATHARGSATSAVLGLMIGVPLLAVAMLPAAFASGGTPRRWFGGDRKSVV